MAKTILIVDDSATDRAALAALVKSLGFEATTAASADEAFASVETKAPDLILMDVVMPGASGYEATRHLSRHPDHRSIPVIIVSNRNKETDKLWGLRQGAKAYLFKPVQAAALQAEIEKALR